VALDVLEHRQRAVERDPPLHDLVADLEQRRARHLVAAAAGRHQHPELDRPGEHVGALGGVLYPEAAAELARGDRQGRLLAARRRERLLEHEQPLGGAVAVLEQPLDAGEVEALVLELSDLLQLRDVVWPVVADPHPHLRRVEQPARLVGADVAHRHPGRRGQVLDRQPVGRRVRKRGGASRHRASIISTADVTSNDVTSPRVTPQCLDSALGELPPQ
jgi:hypothetical protein